MIRNYFKIAWRNIIKYKFYTLINILGLFTGLTFVLLIGAYAWGELQVNNSLKNADRQVILTSDWKSSDMGIDFTTLGPLAKRLKEDYPSLVENYFRWDGVTSIISKGDKIFREDILIADSTLITMYGFKLLYGNAKTALNNPNSVLLTEDKAIKYFGRADVVGESISIQNFSGDEGDFIIKGVFREIPNNSVTKLNRFNGNEFFISSLAFSFFDRANFDDWSNIYLPSYIELRNGVKLEQLELPIQNLIEQNAPERIKLNLNVNPIFLNDYYLQKDNAIVRKLIISLSFVGVFILLMAIVNFINISISTSGTRMREIGIRKVLGGLKVQLIFQFLIESFIIVLFSTILALCTFTLLRPVFGQLVGAQITPLISFPNYFILVIIVLVLLISLLAGLYPAFLLSSLKPIDSLKGKLKPILENIFLRKTLLGFQFSVALIVLISAIIISQQIDYFFGQNLGYDKEYVLSAQVPRDWTDEGVQKMTTVRNEFEQLHEVSDVTLSYEIPNGNNGMQLPMYKTGMEMSDAITMQSLVIDEKFLATYKVSLKAGSSFGPLNNGDSTKIIINEKAVLALGWNSPEEAIGQPLRMLDSDIIYSVQGVIADFHFGSMHQNINPIALFNLKAFPIYRYLSFRIKPTNISTTIASIHKEWQKLLPRTTFEYKFMDEALENMYTAEIQLKRASYYATILSLIIVLLGIVALVSLTIQNRKKEMGVRKILGASSITIVNLFIKDFLIIMIIAGLISGPFSLYLMKGWLNNYMYSISISIQPFFYSIMGLAIIVILLIGLLTWKSVRSNPIEALRVE